MATLGAGEHMTETIERYAGAPERPPDENMVWVPGGTFQMGSDTHYPEEAPAHAATVGGFWMDRFTVTNEQFRRFVDATQYVTIAERRPSKADYPDARPEFGCRRPWSSATRGGRSICGIRTTGGST
jgi:formylglycine-generating enzyme required for sulfatase activity